MTQNHDPASGPHARQSEITPSPGAMLEVDPLSDVLRAVRLTAATFFLIDASHPYCVDIPHTDHYREMLQPGARHMMSYHIIVEGQGVAAIPGGGLHTYQGGDVVIFPQGDGYRMGSKADTPPEFNYDETMGFFRGLADGTLPFVIPEGGGGTPHTRVICGFLGCDTGPFNPLIECLPPVVVISPDDQKNLLESLVELTLAEAANTGPGGASVRLGLAELLFVEAIRRYITTDGTNAGWLAGLRDPVVRRALAALHQDPARSWTLEKLSAASGASRSILAERFNRILNHGPIQYLTRWRMQLAARRLAESDDKIASIAEDVGYQSEAAFSRAFKRQTNLAPAQWRILEKTKG